MAFAIGDHFRFIHESTYRRILRRLCEPTLPWICRARCSAACAAASSRELVRHEFSVVESILRLRHRLTGRPVSESVSATLARSSRRSGISDEFFAGHLRRGVLGLGVEQLQQVVGLVSASRNHSSASSQQSNRVMAADGSCPGAHQCRQTPQVGRHCRSCPLTVAGHHYRATWTRPACRKRGSAKTLPAFPPAGELTDLAIGPSSCIANDPRSI